MFQMAREPDAPSSYELSATTSALVSPTMYDLWDRVPTSPQRGPSSTVLPTPRSPTIIYKATTTEFTPPSLSPSAGTRTPIVPSLPQRRPQPATPTLSLSTGPPPYAITKALIDKLAGYSIQEQPPSLANRLATGWIPKTVKDLVDAAPDERPRIFQKTLEVARHLLPNDSIVDTSDFVWVIGSICCNAAKQILLEMDPNASQYSFGAIRGLEALNTSRKAAWRGVSEDFKASSLPKKISQTQDLLIGGPASGIARFGLIGLVVLRKSPKIEASLVATLESIALPHQQFLTAFLLMLVSNLLSIEPDAAPVGSEAPNLSQLGPTL